MAVLDQKEGLVKEFGEHFGKEVQKFLKLSR